jgi:cell division protein FtsB
VFNLENKKELMDYIEKLEKRIKELKEENKYLRHDKAELKKLIEKLKK